MQRSKRCASMPFSFSLSLSLSLGRQPPTRAETPKNTIILQISRFAPSPRHRCFGGLQSFVYSRACPYMFLFSHSSSAGASSRGKCDPVFSCAASKYDRPLSAGRQKKEKETAIIPSLDWTRDRLSRKRNYRARRKNRNGSTTHSKREAGKKAATGPKDIKKTWRIRAEQGGTQAHAARTLKKTQPNNKRHPAKKDNKKK